MGRLGLTHGAVFAAGVPRIFTQIKQEVYRVVRASGVRVAILLDDHFLLAQGQGRTMYQEEMLLLILTSLGFTFGPEKLQLACSQQGRHLGMMVDLERMRFVVPEDKVEKLVHLAEQLALQRGVDRRALASFAGKLICLKIPIAYFWKFNYIFKFPLYCFICRQGLGSVSSHPLSTPLHAAIVPGHAGHGGLGYRVPNPRGGGGGYGPLDLAAD